MVTTASKPKVIIKKANKLRNTHIVKRVAVYVRVSSTKFEQQSSLENQIKYLTKKVEDHDEWELFEVYSDDGISGTNIAQRRGMKKLISDALSGRFDLVLIKSVSRYTRNVADAYGIASELKRSGVLIYFDEEHFSTADPDWESTLSLYANQAQKESERTSARINWATQNNMRNGVLHYSPSLYGYKRIKDGRSVEIVANEAKVVRRIFHDYAILGKTASAIAQELNKDGLTTRLRKRWSSSAVNRILDNEKYVGDFLCQKTFTEDYLSKEVKVNNGERAQYLYKNAHIPIIDRETYNLARALRRDTVRMQGRYKKNVYDRNNPLAGKIVCNRCGDFYSRKALSGKSKILVWYCNNKYQHEKCASTVVREKVLREKSCLALNYLIEHKDELKKKVEAKLGILNDIQRLDEEREDFQNLLGEMAALSEQMSMDVLNHVDIRDQLQEYNKKQKIVNENEGKMRRMEQQLDQLEKEYDGYKIFLANLDLLPKRPLKEADMELFGRLLDQAKITQNGYISFHFKSGDKVRYPLEKTTERKAIKLG